MSKDFITEEYKEKITNKIQAILNVRFKNEVEKTYIKKSRNYLNFACPICGDSERDANKKRGYLYWDDLYYHCFDCGEHYSLNKFLSYFDQAFEGEDKVYVTNYINDNHRLNLTTSGSIDFYLFDKMEELAIPFDEFLNIFDVYVINEHTYRAYPYLHSRLLTTKLNNFLYDPKNCELYILNRARNGGIIGYQTRKLQGTGSRYKTYNLESMYEKMNKNCVKKCDLMNDYGLTEDDLMGLNKISMVFGIMNVNLTKTFTIFEGPIDSFFMKNSVAICGVNKKVADFEKLPTARYFFDNDEVGRKAMCEKLKLGNNVFMWDKFCKDFNISTKKVKDMNDLVKYEYSKKTGCFQHIKNYFTNEPLDLIYV